MPKHPFRAARLSGCVATYSTYRICRSQQAHPVDCQSGSARPGLSLAGARARPRRPRGRAPASSRQALPATPKPNCAPAWFDSSWAAAVLGLPSAKPAALPRKKKAAPSKPSPATGSRENRERAPANRRRQHHHARHRRRVVGVAHPPAVDPALAHLRVRRRAVHRLPRPGCATRPSAVPARLDCSGDHPVRRWLEPAETGASRSRQTRAQPSLAGCPHHLVHERRGGAHTSRTRDRAGRIAGRDPGGHRSHRHRPVAAPCAAGSTGGIDVEVGGYTH